MRDRECADGSLVVESCRPSFSSSRKKSCVERYCSLSYPFIFVLFFQPKNFQTMPAKGGYVYILANSTRVVLYTGTTSNLESRVWDHKQGQGCTFTAKHKCYYLMWYEVHDCIMAAIKREKQIKKWRRDWKIDLIRKINPRFTDLWNQIEGFR